MGKEMAAPVVEARECDDSSQEVTDALVETQEQGRKSASEPTCRGIGRGACAGCASSFMCPFRARQEELGEQPNIRSDNDQLMSGFYERQLGLADEDSGKTDSKSSASELTDDSERDVKPRSYLELLLNDDIPVVVSDSDTTNETYDTPPAAKSDPDLQPEVISNELSMSNVDTAVGNDAEKPSQSESDGSIDFVSPNIEKGIAPNQNVVDIYSDRYTTDESPSDIEKDLATPRQKSDINSITAKTPDINQNKFVQSEKVDVSQNKAFIPESLDIQGDLKPGQAIKIDRTFGDTKFETDSSIETDYNTEKMLAEDPLDLFEVENINSDNPTTQPDYECGQIIESDQLQIEMEDTEMDVVGSENIRCSINEVVLDIIDDAPLLSNDEDILDTNNDNIFPVADAYYDVITEIIDDANIEPPVTLLNLEQPTMKVEIESQNEVYCDLFYDPDSAENLDQEPQLFPKVIDQLSCGINLSIQPPSSTTENRLLIDFDRLPLAVPVSSNIIFDISRQLARIALKIFLIKK